MHLLCSSIPPPPAPIPDAFMFHTSHISWGTKSLTWAGLLHMSNRSCLKSSSALYTAPRFPSVTIFFFAAAVRLKGGHSLFSAGSPMAACYSFPTNFSKRLKNITSLRMIVFILMMIASRFLVGSLMHHRAPSKTQPRISLCTSHSPSSSSNLLCDTGSLPECPEITGGDTLCIAWSNARET